MAHWKLKIEKQFADEIVSGMKNFEIRCESDKVFQKGDSVEFLVNPEESIEERKPGPCYDNRIPHAINNRIYDITYVLHGWGLREDFCAFSIKERVSRITAGPIEDIAIRYAGFAAKDVSDELKRNVAKAISTMCVERTDCNGCIFNEIINEYATACMLTSLPEDWKI